jgi:hypothetical protein
MSETLERIQQLVARGEVRISDHGYEEFAADGIVARDVVVGISAALVVEDYPDAVRGPSVLVLQHDANGHPIHILWGIPSGKSGPAVVITGYRPDLERWSDDYLKRNAR